MIIKIDHIFTFRNTTKNTLNSKNKKTLTNGTGEITCEVLFRIVDDSRKVDIYKTVLLICEIKRWIEIYTKKVPQNTEKQIYLPNNKEAQKYINKWKHWLGYLIPENRALAEIDFTADFTKQHFVKLNYELLKDGKLLTYNQALFLLLGLNAIELDDNIIDFPMLNGSNPSNPIESYFWGTPQNQELKQSSFIVDGKITSENLKKLAEDEDNNFFTKLKSTNLKTVQRNKNKQVVENTLVKFLGKSTAKTGTYNNYALTQNAAFIKALKDGLIVAEIDIDANKKSRKRELNEVTPKQLGVYLKEIFISDWWTKQDKSIQSKVKSYQ